MDSAPLYLRDIHGIDGISWWPPAIGWWLAAGLLLGAAALWWLYQQRRRDPLRAWRLDARRELYRLRKQLPRANPKDAAAELSELLRRIAMLRCGRLPCAGLTGDLWMDWLTRNDPSGFDWNLHGQVLLVAPYAPEHMQPERKALTRLIDAALAWVETIGRESEQEANGQVQGV